MHIPDTVPSDVQTVPKNRSKTRSTPIPISVNADGCPDVPNITKDENYKTKTMQAMLREYLTNHIRKSTPIVRMYMWHRSIRICFKKEEGHDFMGKPLCSSIHLDCTWMHARWIYLGWPIKNPHQGYISAFRALAQKKEAAPSPFDQGKILSHSWGCITYIGAAPGLWVRQICWWLLF
jgi:hypothetical protein